VAEGRDKFWSVVIKAMPFRLPQSIQTGTTEETDIFNATFSVSLCSAKASLNRRLQFFFNPFRREAVKYSY